MAGSIGQQAPCQGCLLRSPQFPNHRRPFGPKPPRQQRQQVRAAQNSGPFDEGAAQVKKLLTRDKRELMGVDQIGQRARTEFDEDSSSEQASTSDAGKQQDSNSSSSSNTSTRLFGQGRGQQKSPFAEAGSKGSKRTANPFGPDKSSRTFNEPADLSPTMKPIPVDDTPWWKKITLSQVVIVISFTLIITSMLATFAFVLNVGAVRFND